MNRLLILSLLGVGLSGCGAATYSERLEETQKQFAFFTMLDENLSAPWQQKGLTLRVPKTFRQAWTAGKPSTGTAAGATPDASTETEAPSEPPGLAYFDGDRPTGLVGVWTAELPTGGDNTATAYLFALTNHDLWLDPDRQDVASRFFEVVVEQDLARVDGLPPDYASATRWQQHKPQGQRYLSGQFYNHAHFENVRSADGQEATLHAGLYKSEFAEVVLLLFVPEGTPYATGSNNPLALTLDTLRADPKRPTKDKTTKGVGGF